MIEKEDRRWLIVLSLIFLLITSLPYLLGFFRQGDDWRFTGFVFGVEDGNSYIAKMLTGAYGSWLFRSPYASMPQRGVLAFFPYIVAGKLASNPEIHDQLVALFQIFRLAAGAILAFAVFRFAGLFLSERKSRRMATTIILFGGGLGWLGWLAFPSAWPGRLPLEVYSPEGFGFLAFLGLPHLTAARAFLLLGFSEFLEGNREQLKYQKLFIGGILWFVAGIFQPLTIVVGYGILGIYFVFSKLLVPNQNWQTIFIAIKKNLSFLFFSFPWVLYNFLSFSGDTYLNAWYKQNIISSPPVQDYLWSYGLFFLAAIPAILQIVRGREKSGLLLVAWLVCAVSLAYFPYNVQRRFIEGIWVALIILVVLSFEKMGKSKGAFLYKMILSTTIGAPVLVMLVAMQGAWVVKQPVYRPAAETVMFEAVSKSAIVGDVVLCSYETGNAIPAWAPVRVLAGHGPESANLKAVRPEVEAFFSGSKDLVWQEQLLSRDNVEFIILGPMERDLGTWEVDFGGKYMKIYDIGEFHVYRVNIIYGE